MDTSVPHPARRYNYWLGGKDHFAADRASGDAIAEAFPSAPAAARANRRFLQRAVQYLAEEAGVRQFLDVGAGLPVPDNTHEIAQRIDPAARVLYVDNDPLVMAHARALLCGTAQGRTDYLEADLRDPRSILTSPAFRATLRQEQPIAVLLAAVLHFLTDDGEAAHAVGCLVEALPSGSYLVISHFTLDLSPQEDRQRYQRMYRAGQTDVHARTGETIEGYFRGLNLVDPGIVPITQWRPDTDDSELTPAQVAIYGAVGRVP
ncbi:S-adenosyl methyltransferase [Actinoplanes teichomyceticus]|uniref:S-adenosyl methyltransferase n=2 Tax=Actinoplanes teichomyceticus TaxID=1867 RepID=A0A561VS99_ACTTI|nr:S-adenosyl methyltransferase [Actinoplanes teichomyceticus]